MAGGTVMIRFDEINEVANRAKSLAAATKKYEARRDKMRDASLHHATKHSATLAQESHHIEVLEADLHAALVDAGLAEPKDASDYEERTWRLSSWHEYKWTPAVPKRLAAIR
jgi:hypothetical protein